MLGKACDLFLPAALIPVLFFHLFLIKQLPPHSESLVGPTPRNIEFKIKETKKITLLVKWLELLLQDVPRGRIHNG
jgi:hypothetical protein